MERTLTKIQGVKTVESTKPILDSVLKTLNENQTYDREAVAISLSGVAEKLARGLMWCGGTCRQDTHISKHSLIMALIQIRARVGAAETLLKEHYLEVKSEDIWKLLAEALVSLQQVLATSTFRDTLIDALGVVSLPKSTSIF